MKHRWGLAVLALFAALLVTIPAEAQFTTITATQIKDASGAPLASGEFCATLKNIYGGTGNVKLSGGGQAISSPICRDVTNGVIQTAYQAVGLGVLQLADMATTAPSWQCYKVLVTSNADGSVVLGSFGNFHSSYDCVQPTGTTWSFDNFVPPGVPGVPAYPPGSYTLVAPTASTLGGVYAKDCSVSGANYVIQKVGTDGNPVCVAVSTTGGMANPMTSANDIIIGGASGTPARLAAGANGTYFGVRNGSLGYYSLLSADVTAALGFTPLSTAGGTLTGTLTGTSANFSGSVAVGATLLTNPEYSNGTCTTAATINPANGNRQRITLTAGNTCALTFSQPSSATAMVQLKIVQASAAGYNGGISGGIWSGGTTPTITQTSAAVDFATCYLDGTNAFCVPTQNFAVSGGTTFTLTLTSANGTLSGAGCTAGSSIASGTSVSCTSTPNSGYNFTSWTGTGSASSCSSGVCAFSLAANTALTANYTAQTAAVAPTFSPAAGSYSSVQSVTASTSTSACNTSSYLYTGTVNPPTTVGNTASVSTSETLYSYVHNCPGYLDSTVTSAVYTISGTAAATPSFSVGTGTYANNQSITITDGTSGATICYTTNGTTPAATTPGTCSTGSTYSTAVAISATATQLQAIATKSGYTNSSAASATYTLTVATPTASPAAGTYSSTQTVTLATTTTATGVAIHYTVDGSTPTCSSSTYSTALTVSATEAVNAIACATSYNNSSVLSAAYTINIASLPTYLAGNGSPTGYSYQTVAFNTTGATLLVGGCVSTSAAAPAFSDTYGNTWVPLTTYGNNTTGYVTIGYAYSHAGGALATGTSDAVSCNTSAGSAVAAAFNNTLTTSAVYDTGGGNATYSASLTPAGSGELFITLSGSSDESGSNDGGPTAAGFTVTASFNNGALHGKNDWGFGYMVNSGASAETAAWTYSDDNNISTAIAAFK